MNENQMVVRNNNNAIIEKRNDFLEFYQADRMKMLLVMADELFKSGCAGADVKNKMQTFAKLEAGAEIGMKPFQSLNSFYIINGRMTIWGAALSQRVKEFGYKINQQQQKNNKGEISEVKVTVSKGKEVYTYIADENNTPKKKAYTIDKEMKMYYHALSRIVRMNIPEILGSNIYTQEEVEVLDVTPENDNVMSDIDNNDNLNTPVTETDKPDSDLEKKKELNEKITRIWKNLKWKENQQVKAKDFMLIILKFAEIDKETIRQLTLDEVKLVNQILDDEIYKNMDNIRENLEV